MGRGFRRGNKFVGFVVILVKKRLVNSEALRKMKTEKGVGPHCIHVKMWKCLSDQGLE